MDIHTAIDAVISATRSHLHVLDEGGYCEESDYYVVALSVFEDWVDHMRIQEEKEALRQGEWDRDPYDHIEERERDYSLGEQEAQIRNSNFHWKVVSRTPEDEEWEREQKQ